MMGRWIVTPARRHAPNGERMKRTTRSQFRGGTPAAHRLAVWALLALLLPCAAFAAGQPSMVELKREMELTAYPGGWEPPPIFAVTAAGARISLVELRGRVLLVNFWATWCPPCREEMVQFEELHREFTGRGLTVLAVNVREKQAIIRKFGKRMGLTYPLLLDPDGAIGKAYGVVGLPSTFLIGRDGRPFALAVGARDWGGPEAKALIEAMLAHPAPRKEAG